MKLRGLRLQNFRNIPLASLELEGGRAFFLGRNAQGKTNLIEAAGLLGALRSFRGAEPRELVRHGMPEARIFCQVEHERDGAMDVEIILNPQSRAVILNGARCKRVGEFLGRFPTVALSSHDLQLLRGAPQLRRRALDLAISALDADYLNSLRRYHAALDHRNALIRSQQTPAGPELSAFESQMALEAVKITNTRTCACAEIAGYLTMAYNLMAEDAAETPKLEYHPDTQAVSPTEWEAVWAESRARDMIMKSTTRGPHRDDYVFNLVDRDASAYGSEGQQRGLVVALRLGQAAWQRQRTGVAPLLLADDVLGELDPSRRAGFWRAASEAGQVMATGTALPPGDVEGWEVWHVKDGNFER